MMSTYIATFYSHSGAIRFNRELKKLGISGVMKPVPRKVSSSCGTCVQFEAETLPPVSDEEIEGLYCRKGDEYEAVFSTL